MYADNKAPPVSRKGACRLIGLGLAGFGCLAAAGWTHAQGLPVVRGAAEGEIQILPVQGSVYMLVGSGGNIAVQVGDDGALLVDTGAASMTAEVLAAVERISDRPIQYIINTTHAQDHTGGNKAISEAGRITRFRGEGHGGVQGAFGGNKASIISYLSVFHRMAAPPGDTPPREEGAWPNNTYSIELKRLHFNDEPVMIMHQPANTDGNSMVLFRRSDVVAVGDLLDLTGFPMIDVDAGGSIRAIVAALNRLISITVPSGRSEGGTLVVPGHGRIADYAEVAQYRDMMTVIRDRIQDMIDQGKTVEEVIEAGPTRGYDARYGREAGPWTTDRFVEAAYISLIR